MFYQHTESRSTSLFQILYFTEKETQAKCISIIHLGADTSDQELSCLIRCPVFSLFNSSSSKADFSWKGLMLEIL